MKKLYILVAILLLNTAAFAQVPDKRTCASAEHLHDMEIENPLFALKRQLIEEQTRQFLLNPHKRTRSVITIPVVVHVVYNTGLQNISDAQIISQIAVLNKDFRKLNTDFVNTPGSFQSQAADCQIEFVLARRDPNGDSTTGITRTPTAVASFTYNNHIKSSATGGRDAWPATDYLNIWVGKLSNGLLGYAQFPGGPAATDGVVISYRAFGTLGAAQAPFNKGRTTTHEVGHWLNLLHIWGDDGGACHGNDLVNDTPNQGAENYGCPAYPKISCANGPYGDMFMNYMDYSDDACMTMFTNGQSDRMNALFAAGGSRSSILISLGGIFPGNGLTCGLPANTVTGGITPQEAVLNWDTVAGATSYTVEYRQLNDTVWTAGNNVQNSMVLTGLNANTDYEWRVSAVCPFGVSLFTVPTTFTTLVQPVIVVCTNNFEPNNLLTSAITIPSDTSFYAMIDQPTDIDYYRINVSAQSPNIKIELSELPYDYDLFLYDRKGALVRSSQFGSNNTEQVIFNSTATTTTTYYLRVKSYNGAHSATNCYRLDVETNNANYKELLQTESDLKPEIALYPVPASDFVKTALYYEENREIICNLYNALGQKIESKKVMTQNGLNEIRFETSALPRGIYLMEIIDSDERRTQKFSVSSF